MSGLRLVYLSWYELARRTGKQHNLLIYTLHLSVISHLAHYPGNHLIITVMIVATLQEPRPHHFKTVTFYHPTFCSHCGSMIYGLFNQGVRCTDCGTTSHHRCQKLIPRACGTDHQEKRGRIKLGYFTEKLSDSPADSTWRINIEGVFAVGTTPSHC